MTPTKGQTVTGRTEAGTVVTGRVVKSYGFAVAVVDESGEVHVIELELPTKELLAHVTHHAYLRKLDADALDATTGDLRAAVRDAHEAGVPKKAIAEAAGVSRPTVDKWLGEK